MHSHVSLTAIVPIKLQSSRLPNKNFLEFHGRPLYEVILETLGRVPELDRIVVDTDVAVVAECCRLRHPKVVIMDRPIALRGEEVTMNALLTAELAQLGGEHFLQTHCTNPLLSVTTIRRAIAQYFEGLPRYDSLFSVTAIQKRGYDAQSRPLNHANSTLLQTQDLPPICIENSNLFLFSRTSFHAAGHSRMGLRPQMLVMHELEGIDIDYLHEFKLAEWAYANRGELGLPE